jgi:hypothetical protein
MENRERGREFSEGGAPSRRGVPHGREKGTWGLPRVELSTQEGRIRGLRRAHVNI